mgnify:CR=1 FL=1|jgi:hypothetical protein
MRPAVFPSIPYLVNCMIGGIWVECLNQVGQVSRRSAGSMVHVLQLGVLSLRS